MVRINKYIFFGLLVLGVFLLSNKADAETRTICASGCDYSSIETAASNSLPGDVLRVMSTYDPLAENSFVHIITTGLTITCDPGATIGHVSDKSRLILSSNDQIQQCTFTSISLESGGNTSNITIQDNIFETDNTSTIRMLGSDDFLIKDNVGVDQIDVSGANIHGGGEISGNTIEYRQTDSDFSNALNFRGEANNVIATNNIINQYYGGVDGNAWSMINVGDGSLISNITIATNTLKYLGQVSSGSGFCGQAMQGITVTSGSNINISGNYITLASNITSVCTPGTAGVVVYFYHGDVSVNIQHNTVRVPDSCIGCRGLYVGDNSEMPAYTANVTSTYNLFYRDANTDNRVPAVEVNKGATTTENIYEIYNGYYNFSSATSSGNPSTNWINGGHSLSLNPYFISTNPVSSDYLHLKSYSNYLNVDGAGGCAGAYSASRGNVTINVGSGGDFAAPADAADALRSGDTLNLFAQTFGNFSLIANPITTTSLTIQGQGPSTIINTVGANNGILVNGINNSTIKDLVIQNASSSSQIFTITQHPFSYDSGSGSHNYTSPAGSGGEGINLWYGSGFVVASVFSNNQDVSAYVGTTPQNWHLALIPANGTYYTLYMRADIFTDCTAVSNFFVGIGNVPTDFCQENVFAWNGSSYVYTAPTIGLSSIHTGSTDPTVITTYQSSPATPAILQNYVSYAGINLTDSNNVTIQNVTSSNNGYGIYFSGNSSENVAFDSVFYNNAFYDVYSSSTGDNFLENASYNTASSSVIGAGNVGVYFQGRAYVTANGSPVSGATVNFVDNNNHTNGGITGGDGYTPYAALQAYALTSSAPTSTTNGNFNPYTINVTANGFSPSSTISTINSKQTFDFSLIGGQGGNLPRLSLGDKTKLIFANNLYYLAFTSSTSSGDSNIYLTTSASGNHGSWSEPTIINSGAIKTDSRDQGFEAADFNFVYDLSDNYFGLTYIVSSTTSIYFATSTNAASWSTPVVVYPFYGDISTALNQNKVVVTVKNSNSTHHILKSFYSSDYGVTWGSPVIVIDRDVTGAGDPSSTNLGVQIGSNGVIHSIFLSGGDGSLEYPHELIYSSSTDSGSTWSSELIGTEIGDDPTTIDIGDLSLDSSGNPGALYIEVNSFFCTDACDITATEKIAKRSSNGSWATSTISSISANGLTGLPYNFKLLFVGGDKPLAFYFGSNVYPTLSVSTTTDPYNFDNSTVNSTAIQNDTTLGLAYNSVGSEVGMSYIDANNQLIFATTSLSLPVVSSGWDGNLPIVSNDSKTKLLFVNNTYYLAFSSSTANGQYNAYLTTSTSGNPGSWSEPQIIFQGIKPNYQNQDNPGNGPFAFEYNTLGNYFGLAAFASSTFSPYGVDNTGQIWFATSTNGGAWSSPVVVRTGLTGDDLPNFGYPRRIYLDFSKNEEFAGILYMETSNNVKVAYSSNGGYSWTDSSVLDNSGAVLSGFGISGAGGTRKFQLGYSDEQSGNVVYASSTDNIGSGWTTSTVASGVFFNAPVGKIAFPNLASFALDGDGRPGFLYYVPLELTDLSGIGEGPFNTTSSLNYASLSGDGSWSTNVLTSDIFIQLVSHSSFEPANLSFYADTIPLIFISYSNLVPVAVALTQIGGDPHFFGDSPMGDFSELSQTYNTIDQLWAGSYVTTAGQLSFATSSLATPQGPEEGAIQNVPNDSRAHLLSIDGAYYLAFSSSTNDGTYNIYLTTSTDGAIGSWSSPVTVYNGVYPRDNSNGIFSFAYSDFGHYFGVATFATGTNKIEFTTSTDGITWSDPQGITTTDSGQPNLARTTDVKLSFSPNENYMAILYIDQTFGEAVYLATSTDGVDWWTSFVDNFKSTVYPVGIGISGSGGSRKIRFAYFRDSYDAAAETEMIYGESVDDGVTFTTTTIDSNLSIDNNGVFIHNLFNFSLDSDGLPGVTYYDLSSFDAGPPTTLTASLMYGKMSAGGEWATSTLESNVSLQLYNSSLIGNELIFSGSYPAIAYLGSSFHPFLTFSTSTFVSRSLSSSILSSYGGSLTLAYDPVAKILGSAYVNSTSQLMFATSSADLTPPVPPAGWDGNLPVLSSGAKTKLIYANNLYYLAFTSRNQDVGDMNIYFTTSTSGNPGSWSNPTTINSEAIIMSGDQVPMDFNFVYDSTDNYFGLTYIASSTNIIYFATSTNAISWSNPILVSHFYGDLATAVNQNKVVVTARNSNSTHHILTSYYSSNYGLTWGSQVTIINRDVTGAGDPESDNRGVQIGNDGTLHSLFYSGGDGSPEHPHELIYSSSTDSGSTWSSELVGTEIADDVQGLGMGALSLDSSGNPGALYIGADSFSCTDTCNVVATEKFAKRAVDGTWTTSTVNLISANGITGIPYDSQAIFVGNDKPLIFNIGSDLYPTWSVSTTTNPYHFNSFVVQNTAMGNDTGLGLTYNAAASIVAMSYVDAHDQLFFSTSSLELPTLSSPPNAPSNIAVASISTSTANITWTDNSNNETNFYVEVSTNGIVYSSTSTFAADSTSVTVVGLTPNIQYWFRATAGNSGGISDYSTIGSGSYTLANTPNTPSNVVSNSATTLGVNLGADNGASVYLVHDTNTNKYLQPDGTWNSSSSSAWMNFIDLGAGFATTTIGLTPNTPHTIEVKAKNGNGVETAYSDPSATVYTLEQTFTLTYTAGANGTINGSSPQIVNSGADGAAVEAVPDTGYHFTSWSDGGLTATRTDTNVTVDHSFTANFAINTFTVTFDKNGGDVNANPTTKSADYNGDVSTLPTAPTRTGYTFSSWNTASDGSGTAFTALTAVTADLTVYAQWSIIVIPNAPSNIATSTVATNSIDLSWIDNSSDENNFLVESSTDGTTYGSTSTLSANTISTTITGLTPNTEYWFRVLSANGAGSSTYSTIGSGTYTLASIPSSVSAVANSQTAITLSWSGNASGYFAENTTTNANSDWISTTSYQFTGLACGTSYTFHVKGRNQAAIVTDWSSSVSATTSACPAPVSGGGGGGSSSSPPPAPATITTPTLQQNFTIPSVSSIMIGNVSHNLFVLRVENGDTVYFQIESTPITFFLKVGQEITLDTDNNGEADIYAKLNSVSLANKIVDLTIISIKDLEFTINNNSSVTNNRNVILRFNSPQAIQYAISEDPQFSNLSFLAYNPTKAYALSGGNGLKTLYVRLRTKEGGQKDISASITLLEISGATTPIVEPTPLVARYIFKRTLAIGSIGEDVKQLQILLKDLGYFTYPSFTTKFGTFTKQALVKYQKANQLKQTGQVDTATLKKLNGVETVTTLPSKYIFKSFLSYGSRSEEVRQLQLRLQELGYFPRASIVTNFFGSATRAAVVKLQKEYSLIPPYGYVGPGTREVLNSTN